MPTRPAAAPESTIEVTTIRFTLTPLASAAVSEPPTARRSKPNRVRLSMNQ